jgi:predicted lipoprotein with Yx(FWY)xxD motif
VSTTLFEGDRVQVSRFACGQCRVKGPCFQVTGIGPKNGDYVVIHREDADKVIIAILADTNPDDNYVEISLGRDR